VGLVEGKRLVEDLPARTASRCSRFEAERARAAFTQSVQASACICPADSTSPAAVAFWPLPPYLYHPGPFTVSLLGISEESRAHKTSALQELTGLNETECRTRLDGPFPLVLRDGVSAAEALHIRVLFNDLNATSIDVQK
jgi:hypothetical protein